MFENLLYRQREVLHASTTLPAIVGNARSWLSVLSNPVQRLTSLIFHRRSRHVVV